ncbi:ATP-binding protein [Thermophagus xiamenensis]|uniref:DNA polymerase-3 subunit delta n=1 Tax=Thermophagus xiamenensis TaxID=385682 RepID=A0A1I1Y831_9BACT|nr:DNA polymerase III subunit [Thermophagus xiamenensis]SFE15737.1 DNA polymerase-3 subunit delta' [Thermophagus xiamenensis]
MLFKDVIGQKAIKEHLIAMVRENRISHAQLFTGAEGSGLMPLALAFAQYVNCLNPGPDDACGVCPECKKMSKLAHPDLHFVFPIVNKSSGKPNVCSDFMELWTHFVTQSPYISKNEWSGVLNAEKGQLRIFSREGNEIIRKLSFKAFEGKYKIMIIWQPEKMGGEAANRLLKILEEPPARTLFILVSDYPTEILPTILSRTQQLKIPGIDKDSMVEAIRNIYGVAEEEARNVARIARGSFVVARQILSNSEEKKLLHSLFVSAMRNAYSGNLDAINQWVDDVAAMPKERVKNLLQYCIDFLRESYIANFNIPKLVYATSEENSFIEKFKAFVNDRNVQQMVKEFELAHAHIERNGNVKLVLFDMSMQVSGLFRVTNNLV